MALWNPEDALDVVRVSYAQLNVRFAPEAGVGVEEFAFGK
jgi:hypothetical protein